jgi:hypothetical protein
MGVEVYDNKTAGTTGDADIVVGILGPPSVYLIRVSGGFLESFCRGRYLGTRPTREDVESVVGIPHRCLMEIAFHGAVPFLGFAGCRSGVVSWVLHPASFNAVG